MRGRERESWRMGDDLERRKEDGEDGRGRERGFEEGGKWDSDQDETRTLRWEENGTQRENENKDSEKEETDFEEDGNGTLRRRKKGIGNHVIL